ncbi:MAG: carboxypeptidase regulatory-like domain-containing protein [Planctomycetes bacterium]|nr:carboxypeptidase regulatory-like domain-containing protein [Planctomycetota bacterium]
MLLATITLGLLQGIDGIGGGERLVKWAEGVPTPQEHTRTGRVLDALTGKPLAGVRVEAWTEDWDSPALLVDDVLSDTGGGFSYRTYRNERHADKLRFSYPGYRSTTWSSFTGRVDILLVPGKAPASVVLKDLRGQPIAGARVTTRQTCAHGPSAIEVFSDAQGRVDLSVLPPLDDEPQLEVTVDGFEALRTRGSEDSFDVAGETVTWLLGRKRPLRFRLLDPDGRPAANTRVLAGHAPEWSFTSTDADARAAFLFAFHYDNLLLHAPLPGRDPTLLDFAGWDCGELVLRQDGDVRNRERIGTDAEVVIEVAHQGLPFVLLHEQGWRAESNGTHYFPPGKARLLVGGPFTGFVERQESLELKPGSATKLTIDAELEPELSIDAIVGPDGEPVWVELVLEAAGQSVRFAHHKATNYPVPPGVPVTVAVPFLRKPFAVVLTPEELADPLVIDELEGWKNQPPSPELETLEIEVPWELEELLLVNAQARGSFGGSIGPGEEGWPIRVERGAAVELSFSADGYVSRKLVLPAGKPRPRILADLVPCARVELRGQKLKALLGPNGAAVRDLDDVFTLTDLAPGPIELALDIDGIWHKLNLNLTPDARRTLKLH